MIKANLLVIAVLMFCTSCVTTFFPNEDKAIGIAKRYIAREFGEDECDTYNSYVAKFETYDTGDPRETTDKKYWIVYVTDNYSFITAPTIIVIDPTTGRVIACDMPIASH